MVTCGITVYVLTTIGMAENGCAMDKLASLRAFAKVVEFGSFSEAGRQLRLSRSAVSKYVADLENDLGVHLINRL
jgi:molybdenum-dependent DNA-binding transcriptional regulator ModE